ncbi:MAG: ATP-grasp domain-containing protein [Bacteroidetes bacterium]|nr:MAG: ATP-grasp domain-containing protein [Bacteroidota bacterium]
MDRPFTILCIATYFKGTTFLRACKELGCRVYLLTVEKLASHPWPREAIEDLFYLPGEEYEWNRDDVIRSVSYLARHVKFDRIVPLDDFDLEKAAYLREHLRVPGMGDTRTRYFRDKLAMRERAEEQGLPIPPYVPVLYHPDIHAYTRRIPPPWVLKPRLLASAAGIKKVHEAGALWEAIEALGDEQSYYLVEQFIPGDIYHVDSIVFDERVVFARAHRYLAPPLAVAHEGGIFASCTLPYGSDEERALLDLNERVIQAMGLRAGVSHTEFIRDTQGRFYFLETSARVGGAHIAEMVEASSGLNLWAEWARIESLPKGASYHLPPVRHDYAGIIISLAREEHPDTSHYTDPEIVWRMDKPYHVGLIFRSTDYGRVQELLHAYTDRIRHDYHAVVPPKERPTD